MGLKKSKFPLRINKNNILIFLALSLPILSWGSAFPSIRVALGGYSPVQIALIRFLTGSSMLVIYGLYRKMGLPDRRDLPMIFFLAITGIALYHIPLNMGSRTINAGTVSLLNATAPVFTAILSMLLIRERLQLKGWIGIGTSFTGAALLALNGGNGVSIAFGALWVLFAAFSESFYFIYQKGLVKKYGPVNLTTYVFMAGTLIMLPFSQGLVSAAKQAPVEATVAAIYMGIFPTAIAYVLWAYDMSLFPASRVASLLYLSPVISIIIGWIWLKEIPNLFMLIGGTLAIAGVSIVQSSRIKTRKKK